MRIIAILSLFALLSSTTQQETAMRLGYDLIECELIVRGVVTSVTREFVPFGELIEDPDDKDFDASMEVHSVTMSVTKIMRGTYASDTIAFLALTGWSEFRNNYEVGQELVVGLVWRQYVRNGAYVVWSDRGRFIREDSLWVQQGPWKPRVHMTDLEWLVGTTKTEKLCQKADLIAVGQVVETHPDVIRGPNGEENRAMRVKITVSQVIKGDKVSECEFWFILSGDYWPLWRGPRPRFIRFGEQLCVFLERVNNRFVLYGGVNGVYSIREGTFFFRDQAPTKLSIGQLQRMAGGQ